MLRFKKSLLFAAVAVPLLCASAFSQVKSAVGSAVGAAPVRSGAGNAIAAYVYGEENSNNAEELAELVVNNLAASRQYTAPSGRGAREFFRLIDREQAKNRGRLLDDRNFCRIGGDNGVQFLAVIDIEKAGRGNSVWARILDLNNCTVVATAEYTGLIRNSAEIRTAANTLTAELQHRRMGKRSIVSAAAPPPPPPPVAKRSRSNEIAGYVFGIEDAKLGPELAEAIVNGLTATRTYSAPRRGARGFFAEVEKVETRLNRRGKGLEDRDFCKVGDDYEIDFLVIIDIEKAGRGNSVWARILDLETCRIIATGESTALVRNAAEVRAVANEIVAELQHRRIGTRGRR